MTNKLFKYSVFSALILMSAGMLSSCDDVKEEDRLIPVEKPDIARKVLIQEFTGINCVNCPTGAAMIHTIQENYPESVIAVGLHPGGTGFSGPIGPFNLNTDLSRAYYDYYKPAGFPAAVIDGESPLTNVSLWSANVYNQLSVPAPGEIFLFPRYDEDTRTLIVEYSVLFNEAYGKALNFNLWVVENAIVGPQKSGSTLIWKYEHNHVFRGSMTGDWGIKIGDSFKMNETAEGELTMMLDDNWIPENCQIVAFLQTDDRKVEQAEEAYIVAQDN